MYSKKMEIFKHPSLLPPTIPSPPSSSSSTIPSSIAKKKSRLSYSITFKLAAVRHAEVHGNRATARYLGINEKQIRDWRSKKFSLMNTNANAKRLKGAGRQVSDAKRDKELKSWLDTEQQQGKRISPVEIQEKAKSLSSDYHFKASSGWWRRWKVRNCYAGIKPEPKDIRLNNNNYMSCQQFETLTKPTYASNIFVPSPPFFKPYMDENREFKERLACALALLELNSISPS